MYEDRDRSIWFVKFQVDWNEISLFNPRHCDTFPSSRILYLVRGEKEDDSFLVLHSNENVIKYNFTRQAHEKICHTNSG